MASPLSPSSREEVIPASILADIPVALPALTRAIKLQDKAAKVGFDWPNLAPVFDKLKEEIAEFEEVALPSDPRGEKEGRHKPAAPGRLAEGESEAAIKEEFGDMLFVMANIARHLKLDPGSRSAGRQPEVRPPLRTHRNAPRRGRQNAERIFARRNGCALGRSKGDR